ncbi:hypothetical protein [Streptomyces anulatus]|nr:hypothetical protein [Streptomyces anulatus]
MTNQDSGNFRLSVSVMTHPDRMDAALRVQRRLGSHADVRLAVDPWPEGPRTSLRSAQVAFAQAAGRDSTHHLVLQDDVEVSDGLLDGVQRAAGVHVDAALSYFVEWGSRTAVLARWAALTGVSAVPVINPYVPTVALSLPSALAVRLGDFLKSEAREGEADDQAVLRFVRTTETRALVTVPNLVEHLDLPSITGNSGHGARRAVSFIGTPPVRFDASVLDVPRQMPFFAWNNGTPLIVDTTHDVPATQRPTLATLLNWGAAESDLQGVFAEAVRAAEAGSRLLDIASEARLYSAWLIAVAMGAVQRHEWPESVASLKSGLDHPAVAAALATLIPGALRVFVDVDELLRFRDDLASIVLTGMVWGAENLQVTSLPTG